MKIFPRVLVVYGLRRALANELSQDAAEGGRLVCRTRCVTDIKSVSYQSPVLRIKVMVWARFDILWRVLSLPTFMTINLSPN